MMAVEEWSYSDTVFSCDACLEGLGGIFEDQFFQAIFSPFITEQNLEQSPVFVIYFPSRQIIR
jgi:hypothetical protein